MKAELQAAWVLHTRPFRDTSLLVEAFSRQYGRVSLVARGARGSRSRGGSLASLLQPHSPLLLSWTGRRDLKTLTGAESAGTARNLQGERLFSALYVNELLVRLLHHEDAHPLLYDEYEQVLEELVQAQDLELCLRQFEMRLLEELGYGFELDIDGSSGELIDAEGWYSFHQEYGMVPSQSSTAVQGGPRYPGVELLQLSRGEWSSASRLCAKRLMRQALAIHLGDKPLRSRELFRRQQ